MSLLSLIGVGFFFLQIYLIRQAILPNLVQPEYSFKDCQGNDVCVPFVPSNYGVIIGLSIIGVLWLFFTGVGIYLMYNVGPKIVF